MKTKLLIIGIALLLPMQLVFAESLVPEPGPICPAGTIVKNDVCVITSTDCVEGATYQDGICVVNETRKINTNSSDCWGGPQCTYDIESPLKQFKSGIPFNEIECKNGLELVGKMPSVHPKCVKPESLEKLTMRGWATTNKTLELMDPTKYPIEKNDHTFEIQYSLKGATLQSIAHDANSNSIHVALNNSIGGQIVISIPRDLIDAKMGNNNVDDTFFLLIDGEENMYGEKTTDDERIITIWFPRDARDIEIIGTFWI